MNRKIILASTSSRRKALLAETGLVFEAVAPNYEEDMTLPLQPRELVLKLSLGKAESLAEEYPDAVIISADTFIAFKDIVLGKPHTPEKAKEMLRMLSGEMNTILTGLAVVDTKSKKVIQRIVEPKVSFKKLTEKEIEDYVETGEPLDKAGAYAIQGLGGALVEKVEGDWASAVGLPTKELLEILKNDFGISH